MCSGTSPGIWRCTRAWSTASTRAWAASSTHGFYRDGWKLLSLYEPGTDIDAPKWQLFDVRTDPTELHDLSAQFPEKVAELAAA